MKVPPKPFLTNLFLAAVASVAPARLVQGALHRDAEGISLSGGGARSTLPWSSVNRIFLVGGGKAGRPMARATASALEGKVAAGVIAVPKGEGGAWTLCGSSKRDTLSPTREAGRPRRRCSNWFPGREQKTW